MRRLPLKIITNIWKIDTVNGVTQFVNLSACTRLPETWIRVKTETEFPVDTGTTITVSCQEGYINTGSKIVNCNTYLYQDFQYDTEPTCTRTVGKYEKLSELDIRPDTDITKDLNIAQFCLTVYQAINAIIFPFDLTVQEFEEL